MIGIKAAILKRETLAPFDTDSDMLVTLNCDASNEGMGAVLEQEHADGTMKPVLYWSSQFRAYVKNYSVGEKEALACVAAITKLRKYLLGRPFTLKTDRRARLKEQPPESKDGERSSPGSTTR